MKYLSIAFILIVNIAFAQQATVKGTLPAKFTGKSLSLTLINYETRKDKKVQETKVAPGGVFTFAIPLTEPAIYNISVGDSTLLQILAKPRATITLRVNSNAIVAPGSQETQYLIAYEANRKKVFKKWLQRTYDSSAAAVKRGNKEQIEYWNEEHEKASENYKAELAEWVRQPFFMNSLAAVHHSMRWHPDHDIALMDEMVAIYKQKYPHYELTRQLVSKVEVTKRIAIGAIAPSFKSKDTEGNIVALESYRGKLTLVDFWASWCGPCRQESPTLVRLYNAYHNKGFEILSVSIDASEEKWKNAIKKDGYTWTNVSDLESYGGATPALYAVTAIPNSFLLDEDGKIIGKNLRGKILERKLKELMGE
jgi:thiol-disulfide isomerase/thioredoxin